MIEWGQEVARPMTHPQLPIDAESPTPGDGPRRTWRYQPGHYFNIIERAYMCFGDPAEVRRLLEQIKPGLRYSEVKDAISADAADWLFDRGIHEKEPAIPSCGGACCLSRCRWMALMVACHSLWRPSEPFKRRRKMRWTGLPVCLPKGSRSLRPYSQQSASVVAP